MVNHPSRRTYRIRVTGRLDDAWSDWFSGLTLTHEDEATVLYGVVADQSALHGILRKIHDLGLELVEVKRVDDEVMR
ncbi:hypothetical protein GC175_19895 [bacterium]|nr:hypothetical protein [bacterium]